MRAHVDRHCLLAALLVGTLLASVGPAAARAQHAAKPPHPMPGPAPATAPVRDWQLTVSVHGQQVAAHAIEIPDPEKPTTFHDKRVDLGPAGTLRVLAYAPHADVSFELRRNVPEGRPAVRLHVDGPGTNLDRWLIGSDLNHAALTSQIAHWNVMIARDPQQIDRFVERLRNRKRHDKVLKVSTLDGSASKVFTDLEPGRTLTLTGTDVTVRILRYMPWCSYDLETKKLANMGDAPINPALEVEIAANGETSTHVVFAREEADRAHRSASAVPRPVALRFHQTTSQLSRTPAFTLFVARSKGITLVTALGDVVNAIRIQVGDVIQVPKRPFRFHVAELVQDAALIEHWQTHESAGPPAVQVRHQDGEAPARTLWIAAGGVKRLAMGTGFLAFRLVPAHDAGTGMPLNHPPTGSRPAHPAPLRSHR